ncbi:MAG: L-fucokinase [Thermoguttaceae bacterium]|jgi:fucokinase
MPHTWDYLILTASNDRQAAGYESQLAVRRRAGLLPEVGTTLVVADPFGKRVGSGGSTLYCLMRVVEAEIQRTGAAANDFPSLQRILCGLRILILHAGGDSRRVPAYGPCGKIFSPVPRPSRGQPHEAVISTLFDRLYPVFRDLPQGPQGAGQVIVTAGDALMLFDTAAVRFDRPGIVALGAYATPEAASKHGVFCVAPNGQVRLFLQKPLLADQQRYGAINADRQAVLDIAVMSFDAAAVTAMFRAFDVHPDTSGPRFSAAMEKRVLDQGLDLYREICCALGTEATAEHHRASCVASGSSWSAEQLAQSYAVFSQVPLSAQVLPRCEFLHFGTTRQLVTSGLELLQHDGQPSGRRTCLSLNNRLTAGGQILGGDGWVEGCRLAAPLILAGQNVVVGVDIENPLELPAGACLDVIAGETRAGRSVWFVRLYHIGDTFKDTPDRGGTLAGQPLSQWLATVGVKAEDIWADDIPPANRSLWDARVFPAVDSPQGYRDWLWMFDPATATAAQKEAFLRADRYSVAEIALLADMDAFYKRRTNI